VTGVSLPPGSSVIRPKYCPSGSVGALISIQMSVVFFFRVIVSSGLTSPLLFGFLSET
jgi:hypothetical protein